MFSNDCEFKHRKEFALTHLGKIFFHEMSNAHFFFKFMMILKKLFIDYELRLYVS